MDGDCCCGIIIWDDDNDDDCGDLDADVDVDRSPTIALLDVIVILGDDCDDCDDCCGDGVPTIPTPAPAPLWLRFFFVIDDCRDLIVVYRLLGQVRLGWVVISLSLSLSLYLSLFLQNLSLA